MSRPPLRVRVARKAAETPEIATFELVSACAGDLPPFTPGAHIDVALPNGLTRQYSLCNDAGQRRSYEIGVLRSASSRGGSRALHELVDEGDELMIGAPRNHFPLAAGARRSLLLAGGIGVTPILCMAEQLASLRADFEMHYCTRSAERTAFRTRVERSAIAPHVRFHFDDEAPAPWDIDGTLAEQPSGTHLYVCGPQGFMGAVLDAARARHWPAEQLHCESFGAEPARSEGDSPFSVRLGRSGRIIAVRPGQTVVEALGGAGVEIPTSCEQGVCGTCLTRILDGEPDHRDSYLTPQEKTANDQFLPCCSRSKSPMLVLDL